MNVGKNKISLSHSKFLCYNNYYSNQDMRVWFNGRISASQADGGGSIPLTRFTWRSTQVVIRGRTRNALGRATVA